MVTIVENLLGPDDLAKVQAILNSASFINGSTTADATVEMKNNQEMEVGEEYLELVQIIDPALRKNVDVTNKIFPRYMTRPIVNLYDVGMFYREHTDYPVQGGTTQVGMSLAPFGQGFIRTDLSMTLFLCDPTTYDGGELEIQGSHGDKERYKLAPGSAVFYSTGIPHSVTKVTRGVRMAAIVWIQSLIRDPDRRRLLTQCYRVAQEVEKKWPQSALAAQAMDSYLNWLRALAEV